MLALDGSPLSIPDVVAVARNGQKASLALSARTHMDTTRAVVEKLNASNAKAYGVTTGFGALAHHAIPPRDREQLQHDLILSHAAGMGPALDTEIVRGMMLLRARTLATGYSGVRPLVADSLLALLNSDAVPHVPECGSLGASGDLAPLSHVAACLLGEGKFLNNAMAPTSALALQPKEGLALINGTDAMTSVLALAVYDIAQLLTAADCIAALTVESLLGTDRAFHEGVIALRAAPGPAATARNLRALLANSPMVEAHRDSTHAVQDAYSLRCTPQVHGAARDVCAFATATVNNELASVVDNPVVMAEHQELMCAGNFHGQALAYAADMCASLCADIAAISERRIDRMLDPTRSQGLPPFLTTNAGLQSGLMIAHYTAASYVTQLRNAATPFAVHSMSTSAGQEDHVSMGFAAALRTRRSVNDLSAVLAIEAVCAAQASDLRTPLQPGAATLALRSSLREHVSHLERDRFLADDLSAAAEWLRDGAWREKVEQVTGALG